MYKPENHTPTVDVYGQFLTDMRASSTMARLQEEEVREHLRTYQNSASTPEQKTAAESALFQSTARLIPYAIRRWGWKEIPEQLAIPIGLVLKRMGKEVHEHGFNPDMKSSSPHYTDALAQFTRSLERKQAEQKARTLMRS